MDKNILCTNNLAIGYTFKKEKKYIANNININLETGKLIALIGANGIGKSTLLRTLTGLQKPLSGEIFLNNRDLQNYNAVDLAQHLSVVLTEKLPPSNLTVYELVALGRQPHTNWLGKLSNQDLDKINNAIKLTQIESFVNKKHYELSDGQLQKVLIARALGQDTPLIILDEPTTHLDLVNKVAVFKLLKKLTEQTNKCILFSSHDIDLAIEFADEIIILSDDFVVQNQPEKLVAEGIFDLIFKNEPITFDAQKGKFIFH